MIDKKQISVYAAL